MGRYISSGTSQPNSCIQVTAASQYQISGYCYSYDPNECWQNKVTLTKPGSYTFTVPTGSSGCIRAIAIGGGGKPLCSNAYRNYAGAGGGYSESVHTVNTGCTITVVVGRQMADTTISYVCTGGNTINMTGGGATQSGTSSTPGSAAGGNYINSVGGCGGIGHSCGDSAGYTFASNCACIYPTTCCGYCVVYQCMGCGFSDNDGCSQYFPGGGSSGSFLFPCGGAGQQALNHSEMVGSTWSGSVATAGGGGGIGRILSNPAYSANCQCMCVFYGNHTGACAPSTSVAGGGGGTRYFPYGSCCESMLWAGVCNGGNWKEGAGGPGGRDNQEGRGGEILWACVPCYCTSSSMGALAYTFCGVSPKLYPWHDIHSITGSGASGKSIMYSSAVTPNNPYWGSGMNRTGLPDDAGEGAGTGGIAYYYCEPLYSELCNMSIDGTTGINWLAVCCYGITGRAPNVQLSNQTQIKALVPGFITFAGTLGGSGGVGITGGFASKAGFGGGGGVNKMFLRCVCWGGAYDCCNGNTANPALAFPPCILDNIASNAGSGMAIIYWKD